MAKKPTRSKASKTPPTIEHPHDRILRMRELEEKSGLSRWTISKAARRGELRLIKMTPRSVGARESDFWRWIKSKEVTT